MSEYLKDWRAEAATKSWGVYDNTGKRLLSVSTGFQNQEGIAKLAAAAPALVAALRLAHEVLSQCEPINCTKNDRAEAIALAGAALAKAAA